MSDSDELHKFLEHYGVKGMRWGVRNDRKSGSASGGKSRLVEKSLLMNLKKTLTVQHILNN